MSWVDLPAPDKERIRRLNTLWRLAGEPPGDGPLSRRLLYRIRQLLAQLLRPQETFNAAIVEHINSTTELRGLAYTMSAVDEVTRYRESLAARERRIESNMAAILAAQEELRTSVGVLQQASHALEREIARLAATGVVRADVNSGEAGAAPAAAVASSTAVDSPKYVPFEDQFRGTADQIRARVEAYLPIFEGRADVLDIGCGRGEFLALLREHGVRARGIDVNGSMVEVCREAGLDASQADALDYLRSLEGGTLGGLFAAQVIEHLEPSYLMRLLDAAFDALGPGAPIVLETINPACWFAFFESYIRDLTHVRPIHPDTLKFLLIASGFQRVEIRYRAPYPEVEKLQTLPAPDPASSSRAIVETAETFNANVEKINRLLFTHLDYAAIAYRP